MPWFRVDDSLAFHTKVVAAGNAAMGLWVRAGSWASQQLTDGFVPAHIASTLGKASEVRSLVAVGLWVEVDGGFRFHDWEERQPSRQQVEADRHAARERQRRARETSKSQRASRRDNSVSNGPPDPALPVVPDGTTSSASSTPTAQTITAAWIDAIRATGTEPTKSMIGQASRAAKELLDGGNDPERVLAAARAAGTAGYATIDRQLASMNGRPQHLQPVSSKVELNPWRFR